LAKKHSLNLFIIGMAIDGIGKVFEICSNGQRNLLKNKGFTHLT